MKKFREQFRKDCEQTFFNPGISGGMGRGWRGGQSGMKKFREQFRKDCEQTFFSLGEFAEMHIVDGKEIPVVVDEEAFLELYLGKSADTDGLFEDSKMIFVQKKDMGHPPAIGQLIDFDGEIYPVGNVLEDYGGYAIVLKGNAG